MRTIFAKCSTFWARNSKYAEQNLARRDFEENFVKWNSFQQKFGSLYLSNILGYSIKKNQAITSSKRLKNIFSERLKSLDPWIRIRIPIKS